MPEKDNKGSLLGELRGCDRCKNPFMAMPGESICPNCIELERRKEELSQGVNEWKDELVGSIKDMEQEVVAIQSKKQKFLDKIKYRTTLVNKSIDLLKKIEETKDEKYIDEYMALFEQMKKENS